MKYEIPDKYSCLKCDKQKVCKFFTPLREAVMNILSELGNWKDRDNTLDVVYSIIGVNCYEFKEKST